ncbi:hypothetical protein ATKI12_4287 [Kitasatospora sp. Ki12]
MTDKRKVRQLGSREPGTVVAVLDGPQEHRRHLQDLPPPHARLHRPRRPGPRPRPRCLNARRPCPSPGQGLVAFWPVSHPRDPLLLHPCLHLRHVELQLRVRSLSETCTGRVQRAEPPGRSRRRTCSGTPQSA